MSDANIEENLSLFQEIENRCKRASFPIEDSSGIFLINFPIKNKEYKQLKLRSGVDKEAAILVKTNFDKFYGIDDYKAIWSRELRVIEAKIQYVKPLSTITFLRQLSSSTRTTYNLHNLPRVVLTSNNERYQNIRVSLGLATETLTVIDIFQEEIRSERKSALINTLESKSLHDKSLSILIENVQINDHNHARRILEQVANTIFLQIDSNGPTVYLENEEKRDYKLKYSPPSESGIFLSFPEYQYEPKPMSLYWYASSAIEIPLLQYLAYYQVIEYFFPSFAAIERNEIIKRLIKDPAFMGDLDRNITRLVAMIKPYMGKGGFANERDSLAATLKHCLSPEEIKNFIQEDDARARFFKEKKEWSIIASQNIFNEGNRNEQSPGNNIVNSTALRIYEIRCKIVHTKLNDADSQEELLLPFSKEARMLGYDIELIRFVARKVIINSGQPLNLH